MLKYNENTYTAKELAEYYAKQVGNTLLIAFMTGETELETEQDARSVIDGFWKITDLAIADHHAGNQVQGVSDIEFWMHKLFNKVGGYMLKNGYQQLWEESVSRR